MTNLLFSLLESGAVQGDLDEKTYSCSGCSGLIKFKRIPEEEAMQDDLITCDPPLDPEDEALLATIRDFPLIKAIPEADLSRVVRCFRKEHLPANATFISLFDIVGTSYGK